MTKQIYATQVIENQAGEKEMVLVMRDAPRVCKTCHGTNDRNGSAYCSSCSKKYHESLQHDQGID